MKSYRLQTKKIRLILWILCFSASLLFIISFIFLVQRYKKDAKALNVEENKFFQLNSQLSQIKSKVLNYEKEVEKFQGLFFQEIDTPIFIKELSNLAKASQLSSLDARLGSLERLGPTEKIKTPFTIVAQSLDVSLSGDFSHISKFLIQLERYKQLITLSNISLRTRPPLLECSFNLRFYILRLVKE